MKVKLHKNLGFPSVVGCKLRGILVINLDHLNEFPVIFWKESVIKKSAAGPQAYRSNSSKMDLFPRHFWCATECEVDTSIVAVPWKSSLFHIIFLLQFQSTRAKSCQKAQLLFENMFQGMASTAIKLSIYLGNTHLMAPTLKPGNSKLEAESARQYCYSCSGSSFSSAPVEESVATRSNSMVAVVPKQRCWDGSTVPCNITWLGVCGLLG